MNTANESDLTSRQRCFRDSILPAPVLAEPPSEGCSHPRTEVVASGEAREGTIKEAAFQTGIGNADSRGGQNSLAPPIKVVCAWCDTILTDGPDEHEAQAAAEEIEKLWFGEKLAGAPFPCGKVRAIILAALWLRGRSRAWTWMKFDNYATACWRVLDASGVVLVDKLASENLAEQIVHAHNSTLKPLPVSHGICAKCKTSMLADVKIRQGTDARLKRGEPQPALFVAAG